MYLIYKDVDLYLINLLNDFNEINLLVKIGKLNKKYNSIIKEKLRDFYELWNKHNNKNFSGCANASCFKCDNYFDFSVRFGNSKICKYLYMKYTNKNDFCYKPYFNLACKYDNLDNAKWLLELGIKCNKINIHEDIFNFDKSYIFMNCLQFGKMNVTKWLYDLALKENIKLNVGYGDGYYFIITCQFGYIEAAKWMLSVDNTINIHSCNEDAFSLACIGGHFDIVYWLYNYSLKINSKINMDIVYHRINGKNIDEHILNFIKNIK